MNILENSRRIALARVLTGTNPDFNELAKFVYENSENNQRTGPLPKMTSPRL